jgi:GntR family transcriptional repressor for pyruvate dehydrogenase complex
MGQLISAASTERSTEPTHADEPLHIPRAADVIAESLRADILSGELAVGSLLPPERQLVIKSGYGRASVREALKRLTLEGLVAVKVGRSGGYVIQESAPHAVIRSLDLFITGRRIPGPHLLEIREIIEPECAALAAERRSDVSVQQLRQLTDSMASVTEDIPLFIDRNTEWHVLIAQMSGNDVLAAVITSISSNIRASHEIEAYDSQEMLRAAQRIHEAVLESIDRQDPVTARRRMHRHLKSASEVALPDLSVKR